MSTRSNRLRWKCRCAGAGLLIGLLSGPVVAGESDAVRVRVAAALLDQSAQSALPATLTLPRDLGDDGGKTLVLTEVRYCGTGDKGSGRLRAAGCLGVCEARPRPLLAGDEACHAKLAELAEHAKTGGAEGRVLADLDATWKPWELKLSAVRALVTVKDGRPRPMAGLDKRVELLSVPTSDLRIENSSGAPIVLHAVPAFHPGAVEVTIVSADKPPAKPPAAGHGAVEAPIAGQANISADIPASFANHILRRLTAKQPLTISANGEEVDIENVSLAGEGSGEKSQLTLAGKATPRSVRETMRWTVTAAGEPVRVSSVQMSAQLEDCAGLGTMAALGCNVRNGARATAAEAFGRGLTQQYQGRFVHELGSPQDLRFTVAGQRIELRGELLRTSFGPHGLSAAAHLEPPSPEPPAAPPQ